MTRELIVSGIGAVLLLGAALSAHVWMPMVFGFLGIVQGQSDRIQTLANLVQVVGFFVSPLILLGQYLWSRSRSGPDTLQSSILVAPPEQVWRRMNQRQLPANVHEATKRYFEYLDGLYRYLNLRGIEGAERVSLKLPLLDMYVPLKARVELPHGETWARQVNVAGRAPSEEELAAMGERLSHPIPVLDLLQESNGLIILGDPGSGKSTFLRILTLLLAHGRGGEIGLKVHFPILLPLAAYANELAERDVPLDEFIAAHYERLVGESLPIGAMFEAALAKGGALVLLDGLDEVSEVQQRHRVVDHVMHFLSLHEARGNKFILTSRIVGYAEVRPNTSNIQECTLVDFTREEIETFLDKWARGLVRRAVKDQKLAQKIGDGQREQLLTAVNHNAGVRRLAGNPLLLTILALMQHQGVTLPEQRVELYHTYTVTLLRTWNLARSSGRIGAAVDVEETLEVLAPLALWMHLHSPGSGLVRRELLEQEINDIYRRRGVKKPAGATKRFLEGVHRHAALLLDRGRRHYGFIHLTFQEFLAAMAIAREARQNLPGAVQHLAEHVADATWHEVTLLTVAYLGIIERRIEVASALVQELVRQAPGEAGMAAVRVGEALADVGSGNVSPECRQEVVRALLGTIGNQGVSVERRVQAGELLARLGDPRFDPGAWFLPAEPLLGFVEIPAASRYWIARYPVTVDQWRAYTRSKEGLERDFWRSLEGMGNHPVRLVGWRDALHYCRWLTGQLRAVAAERLVETQEEAERAFWQGLANRTLVVMLPSEAEWEQAAYGSDGRAYPWGDHATPDHANYNTTEVRGPSTVGVFPQGQSPYGVFDLIGNVWEWTGHWRRPDIPHNMSCVLRGGSFGEPLASRTARREATPDARNASWGFRVVVTQS